VIRQLLSTTTAEDDGSDDDLHGSDDRSPSQHVRFSEPLATQLDRLVGNDDDDDDDDNEVERSAARKTPTTHRPPQPVVVSDEEFIAQMSKRSTDRPRPQPAIEGVEVLPARFEQFQSDSAAEFLDANKPPWAPRLATRPLALARKWKAMEIYDNFDLKSQEWYAFIELVTGYTDNDDVSEFAQTLGYGDRTGLIAPTRVGDRPGVIGQLGTAATASGAGIIDPAVAGMMSPDVRLPPPVSVDGAPSGLFSVPMPSAPPLTTRTTIAETTAGSDAPYGFPSDASWMLSTGRLKAERAELLEKLHAPDILDIETMADREQRRKERLDMVRALPYINRPLATGVFYLNPKYVAALNAAYTKIQVYAGADTTLRNVPMREFMRRRSERETHGDTASESVRQTFAELVACYIFLAHDSRHRGNQFKSDRQANEDRANELLRLLRNRFGYNTERRVFYDVLPANDERYKPVCARFSHRGARPAFNTVYPVAGTALPGYLFPVGPAAWRPL
jgi:hypothetical protein